MSNLLGITVSVLLAGVVHAGINQWTPTGPVGRSVFVLAVDPKTPTTLYAVVDESVRKSVDGGTNWRLSGNGITKLMLSLAIDETNPTGFYAGGGPCRPSLGGTICEGGVFQSTDGGTSWGEVGLTGVAVSFLTVIPTQPATVYVRGRFTRGLKRIAAWMLVKAGLR